MDFCSEFKMYNMSKQAETFTGNTCTHEQELGWRSDSEEFTPWADTENDELIQLSETATEQHYEDHPEALLFHAQDNEYYAYARDPLVKSTRVISYLHKGPKPNAIGSEPHKPAISFLCKGPKPSVIGSEPHKPAISFLHKELKPNAIGSEPHKPAISFLRKGAKLNAVNSEECKHPMSYLRQPLASHSDSGAAPTSFLRKASPKPMLANTDSSSSIPSSLPLPEQVMGISTTKTESSLKSDEHTIMDSWFVEEMQAYLSKNQE